MVTPSVTVEIAFATDPAATPTWTDVSAYVQELSYQRGRQTERDQVQTGTATLLLNNLDRRFDPINAAGPYYPNVVPVRRLRISAVWSSVTYRLFSGYVENWTPVYPGPLDSDVPISCADGFKVFALKKLPGGYSQLVLSHSPASYWRLGEASGSVAADSSGNGRNGTYSGGMTRAVAGVLASDSDAAVTLDGSSGRVTASSDSAFDLSTTFTLEAWVKPTNVAAAGGAQVFVNRAGWFQLTTSGVVNGQMRLSDRNGHTIDWNGVTLGNGSWYHVVVVKPDNTSANARLYVNGVSYSPSATSGTWSGTGGANALDMGALEGGASNFFPGSLDEVAIYSTALTADQVAEHYAAGTGMFLQQSSGARIGAVLDIVGWPAADRDIDTGVSSIQAVTLEDEFALQHLQDVTMAESGFLFVRGDGVLVFQDRQARLLSPYTVSQGLFGDGGGSELPYVDVVLEYSDVQLWNDVRVQREGGVLQVAQDAASQARYYARTLSRTGLLITTDNEAFDAANWLLNRYKDPILRVASITLKGEGDPTNLWPQMLGRELGDRVTVRRRPPGGGAMIEQESFIEALAVQWSAAGGFWDASWTLSAADLASYWVLGDSTFGALGETTRLAY